MANFYKNQTKKNITTWFYKIGSLEFEIDKLNGSDFFTIGKVNNNYWLNVVDNTPAKSKQTLINRLIRGLFE